jgi:hypothetical protein
MKAAIPIALMLLAAATTTTPPPLPPNTPSQVSRNDFTLHYPRMVISQDGTVIVTVPPVYAIAWSWTNMYFEVQSSTDLTNWSTLTNMPCVVTLPILLDLPQCYFRVRAVDPFNGLNSAWGAVGP